MPIRLDVAVKEYYMMEFELLNPTFKKKLTPAPTVLHAYGDDFKQKELDILEAIGFDVETHLPYPYLSDLSSQLGETLSSISCNFRVG